MKEGIKWVAMAIAVVVVWRFAFGWFSGSSNSVPQIQAGNATYAPNYYAPGVYGPLAIPVFINPFYSSPAGRGRRGNRPRPV